ncbi:serpin B3-like [Tachypleus tridentatus]|uniref:serpin B3-like n=1 Tax=Tachypleus tridentatus TaxID=6853 RepID=UPI003FD4C205
MADLQAKMIELPYKGKDISMFVILPDEIDGLSSVENQLNPHKLTEIIGQMTETNITILLPKFNLEYEEELSPSLQSLRLCKLFSPGQSDLSDISRCLTVILASYPNLGSDGPQEGS